MTESSLRCFNNDMQYGTKFGLKMQILFVINKHKKIQLRATPKTLKYLYLYKKAYIYQMI